MGRRKIEIRPIQHERNRAVTFVKRKTGLFKKAYELSVLCSIDIAVIIFEDRPNASPKCYEYSSTDVKEIVNRHTRFDGERDTKGASDFMPGGANSRHDDDEDEDDEDGYLRKRASNSFLKPGPMTMPPDYTTMQPPMPIHPSLPGYQGGLPMRSNPPNKKPRPNDYRPYPETNFRASTATPPSTYGNTSYYGSNASSSTAGPPGNPYPGSNPASYEYHSRSSRSSSTGGLPPPDFRQIAPPGSNHSGGGHYGGLVDHATDPSRRSTATSGFSMEWANDRGHSSSAGPSPALANSTLGAPSTLATPPAPPGPSQDTTWLNSMGFLPDSADRRLPPPDVYVDRPGSRVMSSRSETSGVDGPVKTETG